MDVIDTILGGVIASVSGAFVLWLDRRGARADAAAHRNEVKSALLLSIVLKLQQMHAWNVALAKVIEECFDTADDPLGTMEPGAKVLPILVPLSSPEPFNAEELGFALETGDVGLVEILGDASSNFQSSLRVLAEFNELRKEYMVFSQTHGSATEPMDGGKVEIALPAELQHAVESRVAVLNQLVAMLMEHSARDVEKCARAVKRVTSAARAVSGVRVPITSLDRAEATSC